MRVLTIIHTMGHGGAENIFRWLAWQLRVQGIDVIAGIPETDDFSQQENWIAPALTELAVPFELFDKRGSRLDLIKSLTALIRRVKPDLVHSHLLDSNFYAAAACRWLSVPNVSTEHGDIAIKARLAERLKFALVTALSKRVVCVSEAIRSKAARRTFFKKKLDLIYNGITFSESETSAFRREFGIPDEVLVIGNVGNLYPVKGQRVLIEAFELFQKCFPESCLVLVGRGAEKERLMEHVRRMGIAKDRVIFTGFRSDVGNILSAFDLYVLPSLSEGLPVSLLEALSAGVPVVATAVGGVPEVLGENEYGILVSPGSAPALAQGMITTVKKTDFHRQKAEHAQRMVKEKFSLAGMAARYAALYREVLDTKSHADSVINSIP